MPDHRLQFRPLTEADAAMVATWFVDDPEGQKEFGGFYGVHPKWWDLTCAGDHRFGWTIWVGGEAVGFADAEIAKDGTAGVTAYVIKPRRGEGIGTALMRAVGPVASGVGAARIRGAINPKNTRSINAALTSGGHVLGTNEYGETVVIGPDLADDSSI